MVLSGLSCPVRNCFRPLSSEARVWRCENGHAFDVAKSGYVNLLGPADKKAKEPGDAKSVVAARRRLMNCGLADSLISELTGILRTSGIGASSMVLDVGCGEGTVLARLTEALGCISIGLDLSVHAVDSAARRYPDIQWIVANGDRRLPLPDSSVNAVLSIASRKNGPEFARVLAPGGLAVVAVAGSGDLAELRKALHGKIIDRERGSRAAELLGESFRLKDKREVRSFVALDGNGLKDLLSSSYRGARRSSYAKVEALDAMTVTVAYETLVFRLSDTRSPAAL